MRQTHNLGRVPILSHGFRPFFLGGALWAALAMPLWLGLITGNLDFAVSYGAVAWHAHEFLFGYVAAIVTGFLLTAIPNWTGRLPLRGGVLLALFAVWAAGRGALLAVDVIGFIPAAIIDSCFLLTFAVMVLREIIAGHDWRNAKVAALVTLLAAANILFHVEVFVAGGPDYALRAGIATIVGLIMLIGGRITPSFTRNWLVKQGSNRLPTPFGRFDMVALGAAGIALLLWTALPEAPGTGIACLVAGVLHGLRLSRWASMSTWREPLVLILHVGYVFVPLGFLLVGFSIRWPSVVSTSAALHSWTAGTIGVMTLAVMTRASLGHSGRELVATRGTQMIYVAAILAALSRIGAPLLPGFSQTTLTLAAVAWTVAFAGFVLLYGPMLLRPRRASGKDA
jgi:uncharacterized protein involved in response to NO